MQNGYTVEYRNVIRITTKILRILSWFICMHLTVEFCEDRWSIFIFYILRNSANWQTSKLTNADENITSLAEVINSRIAVISAAKCSTTARLNSLRRIRDGHGSIYSNPTQRRMSSTLTQPNQYTDCVCFTFANNFTKYWPFSKMSNLQCQKKVILLLCSHTSLYKSKCVLNFSSGDATS